MIKLENYKIIKKIASGGMGDVYLAEHTVLETKVAIKSLHPNLVSNEGFRKRFRIEAKTQYKLSHPNIVKLIDFQERKNGLYLIMEYIDGKQLNDYIKYDSGPIPEIELIPLFKKVLSAIKYAHSKNLVHRDIKPSNIMVCPGGDIKVIDFGIAKSGDEDTGLTKTGVQVGTVSYMSPEQVNAEKLDKLTDIYSLGVTLYQMTVGKSPYVGVTNTFKIQLKIVSDPLPNPKEIYPGSTEKLIKIINKATQKKKTDRYQSCDEFIKSFEEKPKKKILKPKKELKTQKSLTKQPIKLSFFKNKKVRLSIYAIIILLFAGFVLIPLIPEIEDKWDKYQIEINKKRIEDEKKAKLIAAAKEKAKIEAAEARAAAKEKADQARIAQQRADQARIAQQRADQARIAQERARIVAEAQIMRLDSLKKGKPITLDNGDVYIGNWIGGQRTGKGILNFKNGDIYEGDFINGKRTGKGDLKMLNGEIYSGGFLNDLKSGDGVIIYPNKDRIEGKWIRDKKDGIFIEILYNGSRNTTNWKNGKKILPSFEVTGIVRDDKGIPLPGAKISIKNSGDGVSANFDGYFKIEVKVGQTIVISYRGYIQESREIKDGLNRYRITLRK